METNTTARQGTNAIPPKTGRRQLQPQVRLTLPGTHPHRLSLAPTPRRAPTAPAPERLAGAPSDPGPSTNRAGHSRALHSAVRPTPRDGGRPTPNISDARYTETTRILS